MSIINAMRTVGNSTVPSRKLLMVSLLDVLFEMTDHFRHFSVVEEDIDSQRISARFYETVIEHHRDHHEVSFYAEQLCLSPKYFSEVIKRETGHSAKYWIAAYLIITARMLLRGRSDLNIQQISDMLGYEDQTSFCRHFKKAVGMSPSKFRHQKE